MGCFSWAEARSIYQSVSSSCPFSTTLWFLRWLSSSELEACVKGYENATFQSCSSVAEGNIKFQLFTQRVVEMFTTSDPFCGVGALMPRQKEEPSESISVAQPTTPVQVAAVHLQPSVQPQVAESSKAASKRRAIDPSLTPFSDKPKVARPGDGWYVVHTGFLPGVYFGV
jgi:hypothetical protein